MDLMKLLRLLADRALAMAIVVAGLVAILVGWIGMSGTAYPAEQLPYLLSGGLFGAVLIGIGATVWLSADLHDEWRKLDGVELVLRELKENAGQWQAVPLIEAIKTTNRGGPNGAATNGSSSRRVRAGAATRS
jgi:hypothetical protein